jgi:hypothetical protein
MKRKSRNQNRRRNYGHHEVQPIPQIPAPTIHATTVPTKKTLYEKVALWIGILPALVKAAEMIIDHWP